MNYIRMDVRGHTFILRNVRDYSELCRALVLWIINPQLDFNRRDAMAFLALWRIIP
jgi:hypothetical protein